ncbi:hypothetical protein AAE478_003675 [Parahypoxylon ruwenzoriense]
MATTRSTSVTIDREHFETLLRRANIVNISHDNRYQSDLYSSRLDAVVCLTKDEYDGLLLVKRQYENIRRSLLGAGVTEDVLVTLSQSSPSSPQISNTPDAFPSYKREEMDDGGARLNPASRPETRPAPHAPNNSHMTPGPTHNGGPGLRSRQADKHHHDWADPDPAGVDDSPSYSADGQVPDANTDRVQRPQYPRMCRRTLVVSGLPDKTTHWEVTSVVQGGLLLDVFLRAADRVALVSFLIEEDAIQFYEHARKNDIYIKNKRVFIKWAERHFHLAAHVASKIAIGATRNMIIRRCDPRITEDAIRDDLEHIHNLVVIKVDFSGSSCYIKTNSVHNAMFARTCMMSRAKYKGSKIEWDVDECERPIEVIPKAQFKQQKSRQPKKPAVGMRNRFASLRLDDDDNIDNIDETDDKIDTSSELPGTVDVTA